MDTIDYNQTNWKTGDVIEEDKLNNIEEFLVKVVTSLNSLNTLLESYVQRAELDDFLTDSDLNVLKSEISEVYITKDDVQKEYLNKLDSMNLCPTSKVQEEVQKLDDKITALEQRITQLEQ